MTNKLLLAAIGFGPTLRLGWFDQCKRNPINSLAKFANPRGAVERERFWGGGRVN
jgi:hypothetical protein